MALIKNALLYCKLPETGIGNYEINKSWPIFINGLLYGHVTSSCGKFSQPSWSPGVNLLPGRYYFNYGDRINASEIIITCNNRNPNIGLGHIDVDQSTEVVNASLNTLVTFGFKPTFQFNIPDRNTKKRIIQNQPTLVSNVSGPLTSWISYWEETNTYPNVFESEELDIQIDINGVLSPMTDLIPVYGDFDIPAGGGFGRNSTPKNTSQIGTIGIDEFIWASQMKTSLISIFEQLISSVPDEIVNNGTINGQPVPPTKLTREDKIFTILNLQNEIDRETTTTSTLFKPYDFIKVTDLSEHNAYLTIGKSSTVLELLRFILFSPAEKFEINATEKIKIERAALFNSLNNDKLVQDLMKNPR